MTNEELAMKKLFESAAVGNLSLKNHFIRSATFEYAYDNDKETFADRLLPMYENLAANGVAAIITGMVGIDENSRAASVMVKPYGPNFVPELKKLSDRVHNFGTKLIMQINHCGQKAGQIDGTGIALGPSDNKDSNGNPVKGMSLGEIKAVIANFAATLIRN